MNRKVVLKSRPVGIPEAGHFEIVSGERPEPGPNQVLVRNIFLSVEPAMRGWVNAAANYMEPVALGAVMRAFASGQVIESNDPLYKPGDFVMGMFGWQDYAAVERGAIERKVPKEFLSASLGILGLNGMTAYFGLLDLGQPRPGDTVVVSTAAGAVGSCVGQIARLAGCRVVGITGGPDKVRLCTETFGYDAAIDYKGEQDLPGAVRSACPDGVNVYFDSTSGPISDAVLAHLAMDARVVICGTAAVANWDPPPLGPRPERHLLTKRARMMGLLAPSYRHRFPEAVAWLERRIAEGRIVHREEILDGIERAPGSIAALYRGENLGKRLIRLDDSY